MKHILSILLAVWLLAVAFPLHAMPVIEDVQAFTLKNGMKVLVLEDHGIPNVTLQIFFKVGSRNEYPGITGLSHFLELMMFKGAAKYGPKMFDRVLENAGELIAMHFPKDNLQFVLIGKAAELHDQVKKYGELSEKDIKSDGF